MNDSEDVPIFGERVPGESYVPRPSAYALIQDSLGRIAVVRTSRGVFLPGGGLEGRETEEEAAVREVQEECGLSIRAGKHIGRAVQLVYSPTESAYFEKSSLFLEGHGDASHPAGRRNDDHRLDWLPLTEAAYVLSHESHRWAVHRWRSSSSSVSQSRPMAGG